MPFSLQRQQDQDALDHIIGTVMGQPKDGSLMKALCTVQCNDILDFVSMPWWCCDLDGVLCDDNGIELPLSTDDKMLLRVFHSFYLHHHAQGLSHGTDWADWRTWINLTAGDFDAFYSSIAGTPTPRTNLTPWARDGRNPDRSDGWKPVVVGVANTDTISGFADGDTASDSTVAVTPDDKPIADSPTASTLSGMPVSTLVTPSVAVKPATVVNAVPVLNAQGLLPASLFPDQPMGSADLVTSVAVPQDPASIPVDPKTLFGSDGDVNGLASPPTVRTTVPFIHEDLGFAPNREPVNFPQRVTVQVEAGGDCRLRSRYERVKDGESDKTGCLFWLAERLPSRCRERRRAGQPGGCG